MNERLYEPGASARLDGQMPTCVCGHPYAEHKLAENGTGPLRCPDPKQPHLANTIQIGGGHYQRLTPQPWDVITAWGLDFLAGNVVKYIARFKEKGGLEDLMKARHYLDKLIEVEKERSHA